MLVTQEHSDFTQPRPAPLALRVGFWGCIAIAIAVVIRRVVALSTGGSASSYSSPTADLDRTFAGHTALTLAHILPALLFVILAPIVLMSRSRTFAWAERLLFPVGGIVGITAYAMSGFSIGGWLERSAVLFFNSIFLFSLWRAYREKPETVQRRRWLLRAIVVLLGIATTRPVMGVFFATSRLTHLQPGQFFGMAFWIGFSINAIVIELWLRRTKTA